MKHLLVFALTALPLVAFAGPKEKEEAQKHIAKATEAHQAGKFDVALTELQTAYTLDPQPDLLYAIGQVHVKLNKCDDAVASYEKFLASNPPAEPAAAAKEAIQTCKASAPTTAAAPTSEPATEPAAAPADPPKPEGKAFYTDTVGSVLVGTGTVSMIVGVVLYSTAVSKLDDAERAPTHEEHSNLVDEAKGRRNTALVFGVIGAAAAGIGVWHYTKFKREQQSVTVAPSTNGGMVTWQGRF
jgi:tetratricopeptide (TPR) repeat protein